MKRLYKTIDGADCEIYALCDHRRLYIGKATPIVEIYQNTVEVPILGARSSQYKSYEFSLIFCSDPELDEIIKPDFLKGLTCFDLRMLLRRSDDVYVPFEFAGLSHFLIEAGQTWVFEVNDIELTKKLMAM